VLSFKKHGRGKRRPVLRAFLLIQPYIVVAALSGIGGSQLRLFDAAEGDLIFEKQLHSPSSGQIFSPQQLGISIAFAGDQSPDIFVLTNGHTLSRLAGLTGEIIWAWKSPDEACVVN
jgi:hypothetical protein